MTTVTLYQAQRVPLRHLMLLALCWLTALASHGQSTANDLTAAWLGTLSQTTQVISGLPSNGRASQLLSASTASAGATIAVVNSSGLPVTGATVLSTSLRVQVTAASGAQKYYALQPTGAAIAVENFNNASVNTTSIANRILTVAGNSTFHVSSRSPLPGTMIDLQGDNVWLYFEG